MDHILECITNWVKEFDIDGLRLDVAYCLDKNFLKRLRQHCDWLKQDFVLIGELLHGDYAQWVNPEMLHSCTNYECYKGLYSSFNCMNMFEICHSLKISSDLRTGADTEECTCCALLITMTFQE